MFDEDVKLPWTGILLDQLDADDLVRAIIERVQAKALRNADLEAQRVIVPSKETVIDSKELIK